jgi:hypothetical protein
MRINTGHGGNSKGTSLFLGDLLPCCVLVNGFGWLAYMFWLLAFLSVLSVWLYFKLLSSNYLMQNMNW